MMNNKSQDNLLLDFYREWLEWSITCRHQGFVVNEGYPFFATQGLCGALHMLVTSSRPLLSETLRDRFIQGGLDTAYPFARNNPANYHEEAARGKTYDNPDRIAWVEKEIRVLSRISKTDIPVSSDMLHNFYVAYLDWARHGATEEHKIFERGFGLCGNFEMFVPEGEVQDYEKELTDQFRAAGLSMHYPFGCQKYTDDCDTGLHHLDHKRIEWVESRIREYENDKHRN